MKAVDILSCHGRTKDTKIYIFVFCKNITYLLLFKIQLTSKNIKFSIPINIILNKLNKHLKNHVSLSFDFILKLIYINYF